MRQTKQFCRCSLLLLYVSAIGCASPPSSSTAPEMGGYELAELMEETIVVGTSFDDASEVLSQHGFTKLKRMIDQENRYWASKDVPDQWPVSIYVKVELEVDEVRQIVENVDVSCEGNGL
ncbi:MAG: hypothetical protein R3C18_16675 [Planctomycetaceae bacterium]